MDTAERQTAYACDITYGTNNEFGFDYLRRQHASCAARGPPLSKEYQQVQGPLHFAIVDDGGQHPHRRGADPADHLRPAHDNVDRYRRADRLARMLKRDAHFEVNEKETQLPPDRRGRPQGGGAGRRGKLLHRRNMEWPHLIDNALKAHHLYKRT